MQPIRQLGGWLNCAGLTLLVILVFLALGLDGLSLDASTALANPQVTITSQAVARGSVTVNPASVSGQDYIAMQAIRLKTDAEEASWVGFKLEDYGSANATTTIDKLYLFKETNGKAGFQGPDMPTTSADTTITLSQDKYLSDPQTFTLATPETITASGSVFYIVYTIKNTATTGTSIGSRFIDQGSITVSPPATVTAFNNLQSNLLTVVSTPHSGFSSTTSLCESCHMVHMAPDFSYDTTLSAGGPYSTRRILSKPYLENPDVVNSYSHQTYNLLCEACHDGTGASKNIKAAYDGDGKIPGHMTKRESTQTVGWKAPPVGKKYNAGVKIPCMVCHDAHGSSKGNDKMLADGLYDYATSPTGGNWTDPTGDGKITPGTDERCLVCHEPADEPERSGVVLGIAMSMSAEHNVTKSCQGCHNDGHNMELAPDSCSSCHFEIYNRASGQVAGVHSTHTVDADTGNLTNASGTCTGMCHSNHMHTPVARNTWADAVNHTLPDTAQADQFTDYISASPYGLCLSCHSAQQTGLSAEATITVPPIDQPGYNASAHNYAANFRIFAWDASAYKINCVKCHRDSDDTTAESKFGPHASQYINLLFAGVDPTNGYSEEGLCFKCHATDALKNPNGGTGKDFYGTLLMSPAALAIDNMFTGKSNKHPTYSISGKHTKKSEDEDGIDFAAPSNRHAECEDCHNVHLAKSGTHPQGTNLASNALAGVSGVEPTTWPNFATDVWVDSRMPTGWAKVQNITYEWQLCLKCHSNYTTQPTNSASYPWPANDDAGLAANQQTNQALEFNPYNPSYHAVIGNSKTTMGTFVNGWDKNSKMYCSDCHRSENPSDPAGPHGSNHQYVLSGNWTKNTGEPGTDDDLCFQCHDRAVYGGGDDMAASASGFSDYYKGGYAGNLHNKLQHRVACAKCHALIPHGWKKKKMLVEYNDPQPYNATYDTGQSGWSNYLDVVNWTSSGNWEYTSCNHAGQPGGCHSG